MFFGDTLTSNDIPLGVTSGNLSFIFNHPIFCKTVEYIDQSYNSSWCVLSLISRLIGDSSVENMNPNMTPNRILFGVGVSANFVLKRYNKHLFYDATV